MLIPAAVAFGMRIVFAAFNKGLYKNPKAKGLVQFLKAIAFAIVYPILIVAACAIIGAFAYSQNIDSMFIKKLLGYKEILYFIVMAAVSPNVLFAFGEEYGWRGYLLPKLCEVNSKVKASTIVGVVWALYHIPVMILLNVSKFGIIKAIGLALIQGGAAFVFSYAFSYSYFISERVYPLVIMHGFWNSYNPFVLGSIYEGFVGKVLKKGPIFITNGEGVLGILLGSIGVVVFIYMIQKQKY
ncbi:CPBP family intramembrane glutamic endopeptidase [Haloimpatiens sp. FM7315]|uniref:CPBP family intramembrane glutamic endopeptidase n=1 Tax=Haloimpatiens sp. FM7315 TaxID=3298609 RepID=UPI0035A2ADEB